MSLPLLYFLCIIKYETKVTSKILKVSFADESAANLASGLHTSWRHSEWCKGNAFFKLDRTTGQIIVPEDGLYLIYVQV